MNDTPFHFGDYVKCRSHPDNEWMSGFRFITHVPGFGFIVKGDLKPSGNDYPLRAHLYCAPDPEGKARAEADEARIAALMEPCRNTGLPALF